MLTETERLQKHRQMILELLFAERNHICSVCVANNHCELQTLAQRQGVTLSRCHIAIPRCRLTPRTSGSRLTTTAASCVYVACASVAEIEGAHFWDVMAGALIPFSSPPEPREDHGHSPGGSRTGRV